MILNLDPERLRTLAEIPLSSTGAIPWIPYARDEETSVA